MLAALVALGLPAAPASADTSTTTGPTTTASATTASTTPTTAHPTTTTRAPSTTVAPTGSTTPPTTAAPASPGMPPAAAYVLVDANTGRIIAQNNDALPLSPASLSKMFTALVSVGWLPAGTLVPGSARDASVEPNKIGIMPGQSWPLDQVLQALFIISANDAAYALAEKVAGTVEAFPPIVDEAAREMGITDGFQFNDPAGLDDAPSVGGGNLIDARDLAIAARDVLSQPTLAGYVIAPALKYTGPQGTVYDLANVNDAFLQGYPGAIGVKTGYTIKAGPCIAAAATRNGRTMLAVVLNTPDINAAAGVLLNQGFATPVSAESPANVLPPVRLPTPPKQGSAVSSPTSNPSGLSSSGLPNVGAGPAEAGTVRLPDLAGHNHDYRKWWPPAVAAVLLAIVGGLTFRRVRNRRRPAHRRRRRA